MSLTLLVSLSVCGHKRTDGWVGDAADSCQAPRSPHQPAQPTQSHWTTRYILNPPQSTSTCTTNTVPLNYKIHSQPTAVHINLHNQHSPTELQDTSSTHRSPHQPAQPTQSHWTTIYILNPPQSTSTCTTNTVPLNYKIHSQPTAVHINLHNQQSHWTTIYILNPPQSTSTCTTNSVPLNYIKHIQLY